MMRNMKSCNRTLPMVIAATLLFILFGQANLYSQDKKTDTNKPVTDTYVSGVFLENQTCIINDPGTTEMEISHRFGPFNSGHTLAWGIYSSANIGVGLNHRFKSKIPVFKDIQFGIGSTSTPMTMQGSLKWAALKQTTNGKIPLSITWYGAMYYDSRTTDKIIAPGHTFYEVDRLSYFTEILISRSFCKYFNLQVAPTFSHYNLVQVANPSVQQDSTGHVPAGIPIRKNSNFGISALARVKFTSVIAFMCEFDKNFNKILVPETETLTNPKPTIAMGFEFSSSAAHSFQLFVTTASGISYQRNMVYNQNLFARKGSTKSGLMLGFNLTRVFY